MRYILGLLLLFNVMAVQAHNSRAEETIPILIASESRLCDCDRTQEAQGE